MIDKPLGQITFADIERLLDERRAEGKTLDYKRDVYGNKDDDKKELLKDVSSFANTQGGDIVIGVAEDKGVPTTVPGVTVPDIDQEILRLEGVVRGGFEPRVECAVRSVATPTGSNVIVVRVQESLLSPHRVVFGNKFGEFWARSSAGKYSMDTDELRRAFTLSAVTYDRIKAFRSGRVAEVAAGDTPVPVTGDGRLILHLLPVASFRSRLVLDVAKESDTAAQFAPMNVSGWNSRLNMDGYLTYSGQRDGRGSESYTQVFRNGAVEAVLSCVVREDERKQKLLLAGYYERVLVSHLPRLLKGLEQAGVPAPVWGFLTVTGVKHARIPSDGDFGDEFRAIDRDALLLPEFLIDDLGTDAAGLLRPTLDLVWNASGFRRSFNYDDDGKWVGRYR